MSSSALRSRISSSSAASAPTRATAPTTASRKTRNRFTGRRIAALVLGSPRRTSVARRRRSAGVADDAKPSADIDRDPERRRGEHCEREPRGGRRSQGAADMAVPSRDRGRPARRRRGTCRPCRRPSRYSEQLATGRPSSRPTNCRRRVGPRPDPRSPAPGGHRRFVEWRLSLRTAEPGLETRRSQDLRGRALRRSAEAGASNPARSTHHRRHHAAAGSNPAAFSRSTRSIGLAARPTRSTARAGRRGTRRVSRRWHRRRRPARRRPEHAVREPRAGARSGTGSRAVVVDDRAVEPRGERRLERLPVREASRRRGARRVVEGHADLQPRCASSAPQLRRRRS